MILAENRDSPPFSVNLPHKRLVAVYCTNDWTQICHKLGHAVVQYARSRIMTTSTTVFFFQVFRSEYLPVGIELDVHLKRNDESESRQWKINTFLPVCTQEQQKQHQYYFFSMEQRVCTVALSYSEKQLFSAITSFQIL